MVWLAVFFLVAASGFYLGGARREFLGPAFMLASGLWVALAWRAWEGWRKGRRVGGITDLPVFLFLGYAAWAACRGPAPYLAKLEWLCAALYGAVFLTARHQLPSRKQVPWTLFFFVLVALAAVGVGFLHFRTGIYPIGPVPFLGWEAVDRPDYQERMSGTFGCPNHFGNYGVQASLAALTLAVWPGLAFPFRMLLLWAGAALAAGVYFSISRGSWLAWIFSHCAWLLRWLRRGPLNWLGRSVFLALAVGVLAAGWFAATADGIVAERWKRVLGEGKGWERLFSGEGNIRIALARDGWEIWKTSPWWGTGPATFDLVHLRMESWDRGMRAIFTHNDYLNTLSDYGMVGALIVAGFWLALMVLLWRRGRSRAEGGEADVLTGLGWAVVVAMLIHAWVDFNFHIPANALACFLLLGLATAVTFPERPAKGSPWVNPLVCLLALLVAGATGWFGARTWSAWSQLGVDGKAMAAWPDAELAARLKEAWRRDPSCLPVAEFGGDAYRIKALGAFLEAGATGASASSAKEQEIRKWVEEADAWYRRAEALNSMDDTLSVRRATVLDLVGRFGESESLYRRGLAMRPHSRFFHLTYGNHLWRRGNLEGARDHLEQALRVAGAKPRAGEGLDAAEEARTMLEKVKEQIAKRGGGRQIPVPAFNPRED
ncbi:MAG: O-antigen ligase family protein [Verrucomicrobia bacterium]|nr:O-antigen ligase family protein [Verrucomicrobiota bacterium]